MKHAELKVNAVCEVNLLDGLTSHGVAHTITELKKSLPKEILLFDQAGKVLYTDSNAPSEQAIKEWVRLMPQINERQYYYRNQEQLLFYRFGATELKFVIVLRGIASEEIKKALESVCSVLPALMIYCRVQSMINQSSEEKERQLLEAMVTANANIRDVLRINGIMLKMDHDYDILLIDTADKKDNLKAIRHSIMEFCRKQQIEIFPPIIWQHNVVVISNMQDNHNKFGVNPKFVDGLFQQVEKWKTEYEETSGMVINCGQGRSYPLADLHKSYIEARIALTIPRLLGKTSYAQDFQKLGIYSVMFSRDIKELRHYAMQTLGPILFNDDMEGNYHLLDALRDLLDNDFNWTKVAKERYVHVNTIHYRYKKIAHLLQRNLDELETRYDIFAAVKVFDTLQSIGFIDATYIKKWTDSVIINQTELRDMKV